MHSAIETAQWESFRDWSDDQSVAPSQPIDRIAARRGRSPRGRNSRRLSATKMTSGASATNLDVLSANASAVTGWRMRDRVQGAPFSGRRAMGDAGIGWIAAIIIGGIAGWLAEQFMKSDQSVLMNIVVGVVGACGTRSTSARGRAGGTWAGLELA
jgi:hypothetical protein